MSPTSVQEARAVSEDKSLPSLLQHFFGQQIGFYFAFLQHLFSLSTSVLAFQLTSGFL